MLAGHSCALGMHSQTPTEAHATNQKTKYTAEKKHTCRESNIQTRLPFLFNSLRSISSSPFSASLFFVSLHPTLQLPTHTTKPNKKKRTHQMFPLRSLVALIMCTCFSPKSTEACTTGVARNVRHQRHSFGLRGCVHTVHVSLFETELTGALMPLPRTSSQKSLVPPQCRCPSRH